MRDAADAWLSDNDPDHDTSGWRDLWGGEYWSPRQEVAWGSESDVLTLVESREAHRVGYFLRTCESCFSPFDPVDADHRFCSERCAVRERVRRHRSDPEKRAAENARRRKRRATSRGVTANF